MNRAYETKEVMIMTGLTLYQIKKIYKEVKCKPFRPSGKRGKKQYFSEIDLELLKAYSTPAKKD
jgi:hypothetical protein